MSGSEEPIESKPKENVSTLIAEAQLVLAEKRTSLAVLRTGIAILALPLSVLSLLVATSKYYDPMAIIALLAPLLALCVGLVVLSVFLVTRAVLRIHRQDALLEELKHAHRTVAYFFD